MLPVSPLLMKSRFTTLNASRAKLSCPSSGFTIAATTFAWHEERERLPAQSCDGQEVEESQ